MGLMYFRGDATRDQLKSQIQASIDSLVSWANENDESLVALRKWFENVSSSEKGEISEVELCHWILYQPTGFPGKDIKWRA